MNFKLFSALSLVSWLTFGVNVSSASIPTDDNQKSVEEFVRVRCSTDGKDVYTEWQGSIYAYPQQEQPRKLFNILGVNVSRCLQNQQGQWVMTGRELNYYLDPVTSKVIHQWENPWTKEIVPVVHVANNPVQSIFSGKTYGMQRGNNIVYVIDVPLSYPNILANDPQYQDYSPESLYQAGEFFTIIVPVNEVKNPRKPAALNVMTDWMRVGPWLPWMKMKGKPGYLVYSAIAKKTLRFQELSPILQEEINTRLPLYRTAPGCFLKAKNETSWSYFRKYFPNYLQGTRFPIPDTINKEDCQ